MFDVFANETNIRVRKLPFPHIVVDNVFNKDFYQLMCLEFDARLRKGFAPKFNRNKFWKFSHYDAYCWSFDPKKDHAFSDFFYSMPWRRWVNRFFNLNLTKNMIAEFHHHPPNSAGGYIHNDYDISSFKREPLANGINAHTHQIDYRGRTPGADIYCVRSIAILYYFNNHKWQESDGGETALYTDYKKGSEPVIKVAPHNNRMLAFEISPKSFHAFLNNKKNVRNSMVQWMHSPEAYVTARYGESAK